MKIRITSFLLAVLFFGCSDNESNVSEKQLYLAGADNGRPAYWDGKDIVIVSGGKGRIVGVAKKGSTVYVGGYSSEFPDKMVVWKDGKANLFFDQEPHSHIEGFTMINNDFYFGGTLDSTKKDNPEYIYWRQVKYWKNGEGVGLSTKSNTSRPSFSMMRAIGNDLYVAGSSPSGAALWRNGLLTDICLNFALSDPKAIDLAVDNDNTFVLYHGCEGTIWNNGKITEPHYDGEVLDSWGIDTANDTLYIATQVYNKNGGPIIPMYVQKPVDIQGSYMIKTLALPFNVFATTHDIAINGKDVYVLGSDLNPVTRIIVWKNGKLVAPFDGNNTSFISFSMHIL